ncbi:MAG TPA: hypothetical protein VKU77_29145 [Streptosporangiaceae bacterium]|nr:hypothetical protein [Streptosporangiaceae bacterium]
MSEQIAPGIPADLARMDGELIRVFIHPDTSLAYELGGLDADLDGDGEYLVSPGRLDDLVRLIRTCELDRRIDPAIPTNQGWKAGRRIYVRSAKGSRLSDALWGIGANWDRDEYCLWVGSGKKDQAIALIREDDQRKAAAAATRSLGLLVKIPFDAAKVREQAKKLGAVWMKDARAWAMPDASSLGKVQVLVGEWMDADKARKDKEKAARAASRALRSRTPEEIIAASGRTVIPGSEAGTFAGELEGYMKRAEAEGYAVTPGTVRIVKGLRYLVVKSSVAFWNQDMCDDQMPHWQPGWKFFWSGIAVEPTSEERAQDEQAAAAQ